MNEELKVIIKAEVDKYKKGIEDAKKGTKEFSSAVDKVKDVASKSFKAVGKVVETAAKGIWTATKTIAKGIGVAATAIGALGVKALNSYADYEQLVGGVETLFGESSQTIQKYAAEAYKTAGISANDYMEQATSFSASLLQSLGGDTKAAAETTNMAIIDMADNANKMGTSLESIQDAYQGFAKQNYTMLDNLKLGYGGTKEEMERLLADAEKISGVKYDISNLNDVYQAIHIIQNELGITGTTALEASTTISGSIGMMKSAWSNLLAGLANGNADIGGLVDNFTNSIVTAADNIIPKLLTILPNLTKGFQELVSRLLPKIPPIIQQILPTLIAGAVGLIQGVVDVLPDLVAVIVECLPTLIEGIVTLINGIIEALPALIQPICEALPTLVPQLIEGFLTLIISLCENFSTFIQPIIDMLPDLITNVVDTLIANLPTLIDGVIQLILGIVGATGQIIEKLVPMIPQIIMSIVGAIIDNLPAIIDGILQVIAAVLDTLVTLVDSIWEMLCNCWDWIVDNVLAPIGNWVYENVIKPIVDFFKGLWEDVSGFFKNLWDDITGIFKTAADWFYNNVIAPVINFFKGVWDSVSGFFSNLWSDIKGIFGTVADWFKQHVTEPIAKFFKSMGDKIKDIWNGIWNAIKKVVNAIIGGINGMIRGVCSGVNFVIRALNKIHFDIPDWVPLVGGKSFGFSIGEITAPQIPLLAEGGILTKPTLNIAGEKGAEGVFPLTGANADGWMNNLADKLADRLFANKGEAAPVFLQVDGRTFAEISVDAINALTRQRGGLALNLV